MSDETNQIDRAINRMNKLTEKNGWRKSLECLFCFNCFPKEAFLSGHYNQPTNFKSLTKRGKSGSL